MERFIYDALSALRCAPWLPRYLAARQALGEVESVDLEGFHPLPFYTNIRDFYWWVGRLVGRVVGRVGGRVGRWARAHACVGVRVLGLCS